MPKATLAALAKDKAKLRAVLLYHVAKGKLTAAKVVKLSRSRRSTAGAEGPRQPRQGLRSAARSVIKTDIGASNGVIHVINKVLIPPKP